MTSHDGRQVLVDFLVANAGYNGIVLGNPHRIADAILTAFEVRPRGTVTDAEESMPVELLRMFVREHDEGDGPERVAVEVSDLRHVLRLLDAAGGGRS